MKTIKNLFTASTVLGMALLAIGLFGLGIRLLMYTLYASAYNEAELARAQALSDLPTLVPQQGVIPTESFRLLPNENAPVAFASNLESFTLLGPAPTPLSGVNSAPTAEPTLIPLPSIVGIAIPSILGLDGVNPLSAVVEAVHPVYDETGGWRYGTPKEDPLRNVGWQSGSGVPGGGRAIEFNGHVTWCGSWTAEGLCTSTVPAVFHYLSSVKPKDESGPATEVIVTTDDGGRHRYEVRQVLPFPYNTSEGIDYLSQLESRQEDLVVLITCINASYSGGRLTYLNRLIVVAVKSD